MGKAMYEIRVESCFSAPHQLRMYDCQYEPLHAHEWRVRAMIAAKELDEIGVVVDFRRVRQWVEEIVAPFREGRMNETLGPHNPSAERVARYVYERLTELLPVRVVVRAVEVMEAPGCWARYEP
jgi:6-pyruvoyltetrahydropterin/6-carboxytetrahydropterin synthase